MRPTKIISGGQTGADQGGLDGARYLGIPTGGTAPKGYYTEKGKNPKLLRDVYGLAESPDWRYPARTKRNVMDSDGTVWVGTIASAGYRCTKTAAHDVRQTRVYHWIENPTPQELWAWADQHGIRVLNVAGNRESTNPGIFERTRNLIVEAFK